MCVGLIHSYATSDINVAEWMDYRYINKQTIDMQLHLQCSYLERAAQASFSLYVECRVLHMSHVAGKSNAVNRW